MCQRLTREPVIRETVLRPGQEFRPVSERQAEQLADDGKRQLSRITLDQVSWDSVRKKFAGELVSDRQNSRLHLKDRTAAKCFVDDSPQPVVVRFIHRQHVVGERADDTGHPPREPEAATFLAQSKGLTVFQHAARRLVGRRDPHLPDDRKPCPDDGTGFPQLSGSRR